jgi:hypothetical protein
MLGSTPSNARSVPFFMGWDAEAAVPRTSRGWTVRAYAVRGLAETVFNLRWLIRLGGCIHFTITCSDVRRFASGSTLITKMVVDHPDPVVLARLLFDGAVCAEMRSSILSELTVDRR